MSLQSTNNKLATGTTPTEQASRFVYIDNLRALMIVLVILIHTAVTYSGIGSWYYIENKSVDMASTLLFAIFQSFTQAFFMSMLFLISGYFVPRSLEKKGARAFISSRLFRLGVPSLIFMFMLNPLTTKLGNPDLDLGRFYLEGLRSFDFIGWNGPLWFALALLFFSITYAALSPLFARYTPLPDLKISVRNVAILVSFITILAFGIRIVFPIDTSVYNFQLSFFAAYIVMFVVGAISYKQDILNKIDYEMGRKWLISAFALGLPAWLAVLVFGGVFDGIYLFKGGLHWQAFAYAAWESFFCVATIIGLVGIFKKHMDTRTSINKLLSENAFGVYVFHAPILVVISITLQGITLHPLAKWAIVACLAVTTSFSATYIFRKIRIFRQVFS